VEEYEAGDRQHGPLSEIDKAWGSEHHDDDNAVSPVPKGIPKQNKELNVTCFNYCFISCLNMPIITFYCLVDTERARRTQLLFRVSQQQSEAD
jgi:hypothetical protein